MGGKSPQGLLQSGFQQAEQAAAMAQTAVAAEQWDLVAQEWVNAISTLQSIPAETPERVFVQRKLREYIQNLAIAQQQAERASLPPLFPSLGSPILNEQLALYLSYVATLGTPDILIVGSSRSQQGIDPQVLQRSLAAQGYPGLKVFNFSVNGATAQVINFVLQQLLSPEQLPRIIVWGDGSRAFNSARTDRTFASIANSPGYRAALAGELPAFDPPTDRVAVASQLSAINAYGFLAKAETFDPDRYYQQYPRVNGQYDGFYNPFSLSGAQTASLQSLLTYLQNQDIPLIYVNLPLSGDYLDAFRMTYERQFQQFLQAQSQPPGVTVLDWVTQWLNRNDLFADPSHLNQAGAATVAQQLARNRLLLSVLASEIEQAKP
jgi:hypothetical protein